jgi:DNA-binding HxlR family transcriptional regulator
VSAEHTAIGVIEGRWKPMLFQRLADRPHGFAELRRAMPGVAIKVLREQLRQMQADGLVVRRSLSPAHAGVRYQLAVRAHAGPGLRGTGRWGTKHLAPDDAAHATLVAAPKLRGDVSPL